MFMPRASGWKSWVDSRTQGAMGPRLTSALWPAGLLVASLLCFAPGFLCPSGPSGPSVSGRAGQQRVLAWSSSRPSSQFGPGSSQTAVLLAAACLAASTCRIFRRAQDSRPAACHVATVVPQDQGCKTSPKSVVEPHASLPHQRSCTDRIPWLVLRLLGPPQLTR